MKDRSITKPTLNTSQALKFAGEQINTEQPKKIINKVEKSIQKVINEPNKKKSFFAPQGDKRLTINIKADLHKRLKIAAIEKEITVGEFIEQLVESNI